jgi:hypothetical protein
MYKSITTIILLKQKVSCQIPTRIGGISPNAQLDDNLLRNLMKIKHPGDKPVPFPCSFAHQWSCKYNKNGKKIICLHQCLSGKRTGKTIKAQCTHVNAGVGLMSKNGENLITNRWIKSRCKVWVNLL